MNKNFADRLIEAVDQKGTPACVGFDPVWEHLPESFRDLYMEDQAAGILDFGKRVMEVVAPFVGVVKINIAFFEPYRGPGVDAYFKLVEYARNLGLVVIGDVKRGDIGHTSTCYAKAQLSDNGVELSAPDAVTLNAYFGIDGIQPFLDIAASEQKGMFILVHTSNKSAGQVQHLPITDGKTVTEKVAMLVNEWAHGEGMIGTSGYSSVGAVVAPGEVERAKTLRALLPDSVFLVPGFGAQGRSVEQVAACFKNDGKGAIVNSSRGITFAYEQECYADLVSHGWEKSVEHACRDFVEALRQINPS